MLQANVIWLPVARGLRGWGRQPWCWFIGVVAVPTMADRLIAVTNYKCLLYACIKRQAKTITTIRAVSANGRNASFRVSKRVPISGISPSTVRFYLKSHTVPLAGRQATIASMCRQSLPVFRFCIDRSFPEYTLSSSVRIVVDAALLLALISHIFIACAEFLLLLLSTWFFGFLIARWSYRLDECCRKCLGFGEKSPSILILSACKQVRMRERQQAFSYPFACLHLLSWYICRWLPIES